MDFIEKLFGLSPDGGNGVFELTLLAIPCLLMALRVWWIAQVKTMDESRQ